MPGPQFEDSSPQGWFRRHSQKIVLSLIVILLTTGAFYFYKSYQDRRELLAPAIEDLQTSANQNPVSPQPQIKAENDAPKVESPVAQIQEGKISVKAAKGNGATHLARQALKEYLKDKSYINNKLNAEQKVYIEDYLQKNVSHPDTLYIGDELSFSDYLILDAINKSLSLTDSQLKNLSKYASQVPSLNY